jgi:imidazole glycerol-phosphate synthase subunit HisF
MLKIRLIPTLLFKDVGLVKGVGFDSWRRVGSAMQTIKVYNLREVDEMIFVDITATQQNRPPDVASVDELADECFMPLTVGGGVRTLDDAKRLLRAGADKIALNSALIENPQIITDIAYRYGVQCVVASIDARQTSANTYQSYTHSGTRATGRDPVELARTAESLGAGEILITSIDRDGTMQGYDIELTRRVAQAVTIPVIASGGAGSYADMALVLRETGVTAIAAASIFHFTQQTPLEAKRYLRDQGFQVRL